MTTTIDTAQSGKTESLEQLLERVQRIYIPDYDFLICEDWDWLVVLQWMQDHGLYKSNPQRPPLGAFVRWVHEHHIPLYLTRCSMREMSKANTGIRNARYPWTGVAWEPYVLTRWRLLYRQLEKMCAEIA